MAYKYCKRRRLFLSRAATGLGLTAASSLFSHQPWAQAAPKKNVIYFFFMFTANIPRYDSRGKKTDYKTNPDIRGTFHLDEGTALKPLLPYKNDCLFIRNVHYDFDAAGTQGDRHILNQYAPFTAYPCSRGAKFTGAEGPHAGFSAEVVAGTKLQAKHNTVVAHLPLASNNQLGGGDKPNDPQTWKSVTFNGSGQIIYPEVNPKVIYNTLKAKVGCETNMVPDDRSELTALINQTTKKIQESNLVQQNLTQFKSRYLLPNSEFEKLSRDVATKISDLRERRTQLTAALNGESDPSTNPEDCEQLAAPGEFPTSGYLIKPEMLAKNKYMYKALSHAFKSNYTRSASFHCNAWKSDRGDIDSKFVGKGGYVRAGHVGAHGKYKNNHVMAYQNDIALTIKDLIEELKAAGVYNDTMIVVAGSFSDENMGDRETTAHRSDNAPWMIINSGAKGEYNQGTHGRAIHPGDIHVNVFKKLGITDVAQFGSKEHYTKRYGDGNKIIF